MKEAMPLNGLPISFAEYRLVLPCPVSTKHLRLGTWTSTENSSKSGKMTCSAFICHPLLTTEFFVLLEWGDLEAERLGEKRNCDEKNSLHHGRCLETPESVIMSLNHWPISQNTSILAPPLNSLERVGFIRLVFQQSVSLLALSKKDLI